MMALFMGIFILCAVLGVMLTPEIEVPLPAGKRGERKVRADAVYLILTFVILFLLCGLRELSIGADTDDYVATFLDPKVLARTVGGKAKFEIGYVIFVKAIRVFSDNPYTFIFLASAAGFVGKYFFIKYNCSGSYAIALLVYLAFLYYVEYSAIRQAIAMSIAINSIQFLRRKQVIPAVLFVVGGALFHTTALLMLVMIPFMFWEKDKIKIIVAIGLALLGVLLFDVLVKIVLKIFPIYERYWNNETLMAGEGGVGIFALLVIALCGFAGTMLFMGKVNFEDDARRREFVIALIGSIFTIAINLVGRKYGIFSRMTRYFIPFVMILASDVYKCCIPEKIDILKMKQIPAKKVVYLGIAAVMFVYFFTILRGDVYYIFPYALCS